MIWRDIKFFKPVDFDSPDYPGSGELSMSLDFVAKLDIIRESIRRPIYITSGFRTVAHNKKIGGRPNSAHLRGFAADLFVGNDSGMRFEILKSAFLLGFVRIEDAPLHIHLDDDKSLTQNVFIHLSNYPVKEQS